MDQLKDKFHSSILTIVTSIRLATEAACIMNYIQSLRLQLVATLYEDRGKECSKWTYKLLGLLLILVYSATAYAVLYYQGCVFFTILQFVAFFVLMSGYLIPSLLRVSQVNLAAGLPSLFLARFSQIDCYFDYSDMTIDREIETAQQQPKKRIEEEYFTDKSTKKTRLSLLDSRGPRKSRYCSMVVPYCSLLACLFCMLVLGANLFWQVKNLVVKQ